MMAGEDESFWKVWIGQGELVLVLVLGGVIEMVCDQCLEVQDQSENLELLKGLEQMKTHGN
jgi:hypothetical protein